MKNIPTAVRRYWVACLVVIGAILWLANTYAFYPGLMSNDSIDQLMQAHGDKPLEDWHPPLMAIVWKVLLKLSGGHIGVMLAWQQLILWGALTVLAIYVHKITKRPALSLLPFAIGVAPHVITISGVIWKDVQMAFALLAACVLLLLSSRLEPGRKKYTIVALAGAAMVYAVNMRYNALAAVLPLLWLMWRQLPRTTWGLAGKKLPLVRIGATVVVIVASFIVIPVVGLFRPVVATHPMASQMIDDIVAIYSTDQIKRLHAPDAVRWPLTDISGRCDHSNAHVSIWISCATPDELRTLSRAQYSALQRTWLKSVLRHPLRYADYRLGQFWHLLIPRNSTEAYIWHDGIVANPYGLTFSPNRLTTATQNYVAAVHFDFGFLFRPYVWMVAGSVLMIMAWRRRGSWQHAVEILAITASGLLYVLAYLPAVAAYDFRYTYWLYIGVSAAVLLAVVDNRQGIMRRRSRH